MKKDNLYYRATLAREIPNWSEITSAYRRCFRMGVTTETLEEFAARYLRMKSIIHSEKK